MNCLHACLPCRIHASVKQLQAMTCLAGLAALTEWLVHVPWEATTRPSLEQCSSAPLLTQPMPCLQFNVALIVMFNYFYTFQQLDPKDLADQLKRQGASISGIRPGRNTADFITKTLNRMSILGSGFLGLLAAAPAGVEAITKLQVATPLFALSPRSFEMPLLLSPIGPALSCR